MKSLKSQLHQHHFWDLINSLEMPAVLFLQKLFRVPQTSKIWKKFAFLGSSSFVTIIPTVFYSLGHEQNARNLSSSLMCYALISSIGKLLFHRRRPGTYDNVYSKPTKSMDAFPSRHTMGMTIISSFTPFKFHFIIFMAIDRILMGKHFISDCVVGYLLGELCVNLGCSIKKTHILLLILFAGMSIWKSATRVFAGTIPVIVAPQINGSLLTFTIVLGKVISMQCVKKWILKSEKRKIMIADIIISSLTIYLIVILNTVIPKNITDICLVNIFTQNLSCLFDSRYGDKILLIS
ncbi:PAP2 superfamily protein [Tritrichomonas foetus]|uniref:PAP2 superfamily protein n=1 Tax=Tritrichomonas foetus TaxID=1144522 RepID=A0A1J4KXK5_9EUKA|nr:PAP2 superfamily protein [Tritrichomonas foetus]|eukprot:OHT15967.1 PAP2 superfamily protein [Tritrichomonas foetus]